MNELYDESLWVKCLDEANERLGFANQPRLGRKQEETLAKETESSFILEIYLRHVRNESSTTWEALEGMDAARLVLMRKYGWPPSQLRELTPREIKLALHDELRSFDIPERAQITIREQQKRVCVTRKQPITS